MSQHAFREVFESAEDCCSAAFDEGLARLSQTVAEAARREQAWLGRLRSGLVALLGFLDDEPQWGRLLLLEPPVAGAAALPCEQRVLGVLTRLLDDGSPQALGEPTTSAQMTAELVAGGAFAVIRARMSERVGEERGAGRGETNGAGRGETNGAGRGETNGAGRGEANGAGRGETNGAGRGEANGRGRAGRDGRGRGAQDGKGCTARGQRQASGESLVELAPALMSFIVRPYLGEAIARAELTGALAPFEPPALRGAALPIRATHRTTLVLRAVGAAPGSTNRQVADAAGLVDDGQASKLLARLQRHGLIENVGIGAARGEPNAWLLTAEGERALELLGESFGERAPRRTGSASRRSGGRIGGIA